MKMSARVGSKTLRIGFVGAGMISLYHLRAWAEVAGARVVAICDPNEEARRGRSAEFKIPATYRDLETMLAHDLQPVRQVGGVPWGAESAVEDGYEIAVAAKRHNSSVLASEIGIDF